MPHPFFRRVPSEADLGPDICDWNRGKKGTGRHYSVAVRRRAEPLSIRLHWLEQGTLVLVGYFVADMAGLRSTGLTAKDSKPEHDRYQFIRQGNSIYLKPAGDHAKSLFIGMVPALP